MSDLLVTLRIIESLAASDLSSKQLADQFALPLAEVRRHVSEARRLGAVINLRGKYSLTNWSAVSRLVLRWIELENA